MSRDLPSKRTENENVSVTAENAGAWVEVYQDGVGWLPLALTPGLESLAPEQTESGIKPVGAGEGEGSGPRITEGQEPEQDRMRNSPKTRTIRRTAASAPACSQSPRSGFCSWLEFCSCSFCLSSSATIFILKNRQKTV